MERLNVREVAQQLGVAPGTIYNDLKAIGEAISKEQAKGLVLRVVTTLNKIDREARGLVHQKNVNAKLGALNLLLSKTRAEVELLQRLGVTVEKGLGSPDNPIHHKVMGFDPRKYPPPRQEGDDAG